MCLKYFQKTITLQSLACVTVSVGFKTKGIFAENSNLSPKNQPLFVSHNTEKFLTIAFRILVSFGDVRILEKSLNFRANNFEASQAAQREQDSNSKTAKALKF